jgi:hypothetical protein
MKIFIIEYRVKGSRSNGTLLVQEASKAKAKAKAKAADERIVPFNAEEVTDLNGVLLGCDAWDLVSEDQFKEAGDGKIVWLEEGT